MIDLLDQYGKTWRVKPCPCDGEHPGDKTQWQEINGKRGYVRLWDGNDKASDALEMYLANTRIAKRVERSYPAFKPKNHYDDATAFVFANKPELVTAACKWIKARKVRHLSPEAQKRGAERLLQYRLRNLKPC